jgi:hypothetical protein
MQAGLEAISEELRPLCEDAENVRRLVSHPWLLEQANATATQNTAIICSKWHQSLLSNPKWYSPAFSSEPVMMPVLESNFRPFGRFFAEKESGRSPLTFSE